MKNIVKRIILIFKFFILKNKNNIFIGNNVKIYESNGRVFLGKNVYIGDNVNLYAKSGNLHIEDNVHISIGSIIVAERANCKISKNTMIAEYVSIRTCSHGMKKNKIMMHQKQEGKNIILGNDVWIGRGSVILEGAIIEEGVVIGANSVVKKNSNLKAYGIYAGNILRFIKWRE